MLFGIRVGKEKITENGLMLNFVQTILEFDERHTKTRTGDITHL